MDPHLPPHVIIPLLGRFKNEIGARYHLTLLAAVTASGINVHLWVSRLVALRDFDHHTHSPAFCSPQGKLLQASDIELDLLDALIPANILVHDSYGISCSFLRGATSEARAWGVSRDDIDLVSHWQTFEHVQAMRDHYSDIRLLIPALLHFSQAL